MVRLHVKRGDDSLFLFETKLENSVQNVTEALVEIHNGILKIRRLCSEIELLCDHGISKPPEMHGLLEEQIQELNLNTEDQHNYEPSGGCEENKDPTGRRTGKCPKEDMQNVLKKTITEANGIISKEQIKSGVSLNWQHIQDAVAILKGGIDIVYPSDIPKYDLIRCEFENREDLTGTQEEKRILHPVMTQMWFAGKELETGKKLSDYFGSNEKTKVVVKLQKRGSGAPSREPVLTEEERKALMMAEFRRREQLKKLEEDEDESYLNREWADNLNLKKSFLGLKDVTWKPH
ncbi:UNVERIFIED_CONTAM: hypothetical protein GTU68_044395 [Idotea baltica]|nr:hypothetical protein [Idotea baltica]